MQYQFYGADENDYAGNSVASAGDVDGDGKGDLIIGAYGADGGGFHSGEAYLMTAADLAAADAADGATDGKIDLDNVKVHSGSYQFIGKDWFDYAGNSVASAGDVDGDGKDDLIIGADHADGGGSKSGEVYLMTAVGLVAADAADGSTDGEIDLNNVKSHTGSYQFIGEKGDYAGNSVASAGDVDGDGKDDLIIGADHADGDDGRWSGEAYLMTAVDLATADAADGATDGEIDLDNVKGHTGSYQFIGKDWFDFAGNSVASAGDVDGDGKDDLIIGAYGADGGGNNSGEAYLMTAVDLAAADAADGATDGEIDLDNVKGHTGSYQFIGETDDRAGGSVASAGDVDGDGKDDLIIGAEGGGGRRSGEAYLMTAADLAAADAADGASDGEIDLGNVKGHTGSYQFIGKKTGDIAGDFVASAGDVDGDGKDDLIIGARDADGGGRSSGGVYLMAAADLAAADAADGAINGKIALNNVNGHTGSYQFIGKTMGDRAGYSVASAGDVDGDGKDDLIIGADHADGGGSKSGEVYLMTAADLLMLDRVDASRDGVIDLGRLHSIVGTDGQDKITGTDGNDKIFGFKGADTLRGAEGDDVVVGRMGNDVLFGGAGDDILRGNRGMDTLNGGLGADVFVIHPRDGNLDIIEDFEDGTDLISLRFWDISFDDVTLIDEEPGRVRVEIEGEVLTVNDNGAAILVASDLTEDDFLF